MTTLVAGTILLGVLIFFHELGHFVVAKMCGVRVLVFSLGFGPRIFGFRIGETDYRLSLLPLGGYVRMFGDNLREEIPEEEKDKSFLHKPVLQKSAIAFAGPFANFILPVAVLFFVYWGTEQVHNTVVGTVLPTGPAAQAGLQANDKITAIDGQPVTTFTDVQVIVEKSPQQELRFTVERGTETKQLTIEPRSVRDPHPLSDGKQLGRIGVMPMVSLPHVSVRAGSPAEVAGLQNQDRIVAFNNIDVTTTPQLFSLMTSQADVPWRLKVTSQASAKQESSEEERQEETSRIINIPVPSPEEFDVPVFSEVSAFAVSSDEMSSQKNVQADLLRMKGLASAASERLDAFRGIDTYEGTIQLVKEQTSAFKAGIQKGDRILAINGIALTHAGELQSRLEENPNQIHLLNILQSDGIRSFALRMGARTERGIEDFKTLGAAAMSVYGPGEIITRQISPLEAVSRASSKTWVMVEETARSLWFLLSGRVSYKSLGGPITIFNLAGQAMEISLDRFIYLLCFISINLGLINLLPVPVLDGGHLLMFGIEAVRRKELSLEAKEQAMKVGFAMLLLLMVGAIFNDVMRFL